MIDIWRGTTEFWLSCMDAIVFNNTEPSTTRWKARLNSKLALKNSFPKLISNNPLPFRIFCMLFRYIRKWLINLFF